MKVHTLRTDDLAAMAAPYNPRKISDHDLAALRRSITTFGIVEPIVVNQRNDEIIGGHQRVQAAQAEGLESLPVVFVDLEDLQAKQLNIALNRISGDFDDEMLEALLHEIQDGGGDLDLTGFSDAEINTLFLEVEEGKTDPYSEWKGMPEFVDPEPCFRKIVVNFDSAEDVEAFQQAIGQELTEATKSIWYPKRERRNLVDQRWAPGEGEAGDEQEQPDG